MKTRSEKTRRPGRNEAWLPSMDLNHDKQIQSLLCYRYTTRQCRVPKTVDHWS